MDTDETQIFILGMTAKQKALVDYVLCLSDSLEHTHHANDRPLYQSYLAEAAVILALLMRDSSVNQIETLIQGHSRNLGYTWLVGPEHAAVEKAWKTFVEMK
jgi:hypothetical protein